MRYGLELPGYPYNFKAWLTRVIRWGQRQVFTKCLGAVSDRAIAPVDFNLDEANDFVYEKILSEEPFLLSRFGSTEINAVLRGMDIDAPGSLFIKLVKMFVGKSGPFWWDNSIRGGTRWASGIFPNDDETLMRFSRRVREDCRQIDLLGTWNECEKLLQKRFFPKAKVTTLTGLEPFFAVRPWTAALAGKKVLVVHSFVDTINAQYRKREHLFKNPEMLPEFKLITYKSVMSYMGMETPYKDWFEALQKMCDDISEIDFDVAILGCGAYGMSLGAFIKKSLGRQAIHLGGVSQMLFGIRGGRFDNFKIFDSFYNDFWTRPGATDRPEKLYTLEEGAYW